MLMRLANTKQVNRDGFTAFLYNLKSDYPALGAVYVQCTGSHERVFVKKSHRLYFIIEGRGVFDVGDEHYEVGPSDVIVIEPGISYSYAGSMTLFEVNYPATDDSDEVRV